MKRNYVAILPDGSEAPFEIDVVEHGFRLHVTTAIERAITQIVNNAGIRTDRRGTPIKIKYHQLVINGIQLQRSPPSHCDVVPYPARMTDEEFEAEQADLLKDIPPEFHSALRMVAYENGHSAGMEECITELRPLVNMLKAALPAYTARIQEDARQSKGNP